MVKIIYSLISAGIISSNLAFLAVRGLCRCTAWSNLIFGTTVDHISAIFPRRSIILIGLSDVPASEVCRVILCCTLTSFSTCWQPVTASLPVLSASARLRKLNVNRNPFLLRPCDKTWQLTFVSHSMQPIQSNTISDNSSVKVLLLNIFTGVQQTTDRVVISFL